MSTTIMVSKLVYVPVEKREEIAKILNLTTEQINEKIRYIDVNIGNFYGTDFSIFLGRNLNSNPYYEDGDDFEFSNTDVESYIDEIAQMLEEEPEAFRDFQEDAFALAEILEEELELGVEDFKITIWY